MIWSFISGIVFCIFCGFALYIGHQVDLMENKFKSDTTESISFLSKRIENLESKYVN